MARSKKAMTFMLLLAAVVLAGCGRVSTYGPPPGAVNPVEGLLAFLDPDRP